MQRITPAPVFGGILGTLVKNFRTQFYGRIQGTEVLMKSGFAYGSLPKIFKKMVTN